MPIIHTTDMHYKVNDARHSNNPCTAVTTADVNTECDVPFEDLK